MFLKDLKIFIYFLSARYQRKVEETLSHNPSINKDLLVAWLEASRQYLPQHGLEPYRSTGDIKALFSSKLPCELKEAPLPEHLLGVFMPKTKSDKPVIVLNSKSPDRDMQISTLGHEIGHLMVSLYSPLQKSLKDPMAREIKARSEDLLEAIGEEEEVLADMGACMGIYPANIFEKIFCDAQGRVNFWYRWFPLVLFIKSSLFIRSLIPELKKSFLTCPNKLFHLTITLHYARLRVLLREAYGI